MQSIYIARRLVEPEYIWTDLAEIAAHQNSNSRLWRILWGRQFRYQTRIAAKTCNRFTTVSKSLQILFLHEFGIRADLMANTPQRRPDLHFHVTNSGRIRLVHTGAAIPSRGLEKIILAVSQLPDEFELDLFLTGQSTSYRRYLEILESKFSNVAVRDAVEPARLLDTINQYDASIVFVDPRNANQQFCLPNKFFDSIQARVPIISGPTPDIVQIIETHQVGWVTDGFEVEDLIRLLRTINRESLGALAWPLEKASQEFVARDEIHVERFLQKSVTVI